MKGRKISCALMWVGTNLLRANTKLSKKSGTCGRLKALEEETVLAMMSIEVKRWVARIRQT